MAAKDAGEPGEDFARTIASLTSRGEGHRRAPAADADMSKDALSGHDADTDTVGREEETAFDGRRADVLSGPQIKMKHNSEAKTGNAVSEALGALRQAVAGRQESGKGDGVAALSEEVTSEETVPEEGSSTDAGNLLDLLAGAGVGQPPATTAAGGQEFKGRGADKAGRQDARADGLVRVVADGGRPATPMPEAAAMETVDAPEGEGDQLFRFLRSDGKGREIDMQISRESERAVFKDAAAAGPKGDPVTVLEARRYIGLAATGNASAVTASIAQDPEWAASLRAADAAGPAAQSATGRVVNTLRIQMSPVELGLVTATLRLHGDELVVSLRVETGEAYRQLSDDQDKIVKALRAHGFAVDQVSVQLSTDRSASAQQQQGDAQPQFSGQQQAREGADGRQQGGGQPAGRSPREEVSHEGRSEDAVSGASGSQPHHAGDIYL